jgi:hypothetical protein
MPKRGSYGGMKVRRSKSLYKSKKSGFRKTIETVVFGAFVAGLVFVGVIVAQTLLNWVCKDCEEKPCSCEPHIYTSEPPSPNYTGTPPQTEDEPTDELTPGVPLGIGNTVYGRTDAFTSSTALRSYLKEEKSKGFDTIIIEMKNDIGKLLYKSEIAAVSAMNTADAADLVIGTLTARQIADICKEEGFTPIARVNTLKDHTAPVKIAGIGYANWLDDHADRGGKRWANPFLEGTVDYNAQIVAELFGAGFADVVFANTVFPVFRNIDFTILPHEVTDAASNFTGLGSFVNAVSADVSDANILLEVLLSCFIETGSIPSGSAAILRNGGDSLDVGGIVLVFSREYFDSPSVIAQSSADGAATIEGLVKQAFAAVREFSGELAIIPVLDGLTITESDREAIAAAFKADGFDKFIVRN